jgi:hypothetical protein
MKLASVVKGKLVRPIRVLIYGTEGVGKSTFGADAPSPIFLGAEDGTSQLDVARFPTPETWEDVLEAIRVLTVDEHEYKTLVVDSLDWVEPILWKYVCRQNKNVSSIEEVGGGFGKGYSAALDDWRVFLSSLEKLMSAKQMNIVFVAHSWVKPFKNPDGADFDRYEMKLNAKAAGLMREWVDAMLFARYETLVDKDERTKRVRGVDTGARLLFTERRAAYDAKNRYGLPECIPLSWSDFEAGVKAHLPADPKALREEIARKAILLGGEEEKRTVAAMGRAGDDAQKLAFLNNWCNAELAKKEQ